MEVSAETEYLDRHLTEARARLVELRHSAGDRREPPDSVLNQAFEEFSTALEELSVAEIELRQQNELLLETRTDVEEARRRYQSLFDFAPDAFVMTDIYGVIREANLASTALLGTENRRLIGKPIATFIPSIDRAGFRMQLARIARRPKGPAELAIPMRSRNGRTFHADIRVGSGPDPDTLLWLIRDVTERNQLEEQVRSANTELERRVAERTAELAAANALKESLLVGEQESRQRAEHLQRNSEFLAEAGLILSESLDTHRAMNALGRLIVDVVADWCLIHRVEGSEIRTETVAHREPAHGVLLEAAARPHARRKTPCDLTRALDSGHAIHLSGAGAGSLTAIFGELVDADRASSIGTTSLIVVPIEARGGAVGALTLGRAGENGFGEDDLEMAKEIARRAGVAIDNGRLYAVAKDQAVERRRAEERVKALNRKLQRAMVETHHRVKNNLQLITAMIDMRLLDDEAAIDADDLRRITAQVSILARVHDLLTTSLSDDTAQRVPVQPVLDALLAMLRRAADGRRIEYRVDAVDLSARHLSALALIVHELVSNALKHSRGEVQLTLDSPAEGARREVMVEVCDDGPGFPEGFDPAKQGSTGIELVQTLVKWDLGGSIEFANRADGGARVTVEFPVEG